MQTIDTIIHKYDDHQTDRTEKPLVLTDGRRDDTDGEWGAAAAAAATTISEIFLVNIF